MSQACQHVTSIYWLLTQKTLQLTCWYHHLISDVYESHATSWPFLLQVYTASRDGTLRQWDYVALECLRTIQVKETIVDMVGRSKIRDRILGMARGV